MESSLLELLAQYGITGSLLLLVLYWLAKHYLPERDRQHREELERILTNHQSNTNRLVNSVDRCTRIVQLNSQALLVQGFTRSGLTAAEAEDIVRRLAGQIHDCPNRGATTGSNGHKGAEA